jgi:hypothetical protein
MKIKAKGHLYQLVRDRELNSKYVGNFCKENFRTKTKNGETFEQGLGLEGIVKALYLNRCTGEIIAEFMLPNKIFRYCELKWVSVSKKLKTFKSE